MILLIGLTNTSRKYLPQNLTFMPIVNNLSLSRASLFLDEIYVDMCRVNSTAFILDHSIRSIIWIRFSVV
jgi:hypothetical protein